MTTRCTSFRNALASICCLALLLVAGAGCSDMDLEGLAEMGDMLLRGGEALDEETVAKGLKEALQIGTDRGVLRTSKLDGYWQNPAIRIPLPEKFEEGAKALRTLGLGKPVDEFELAMNRAAEKAAGEAKDVFWDAITAMTLEDVFTILRGDDTAATRYFRDRTEQRLDERFQPIVREKMEEVELYQTYEDLARRIDRIPLVSRPSLDLTEYVTDEALDGLFEVLGEEEKRIREEPVARTTELLRRVFGSQK